MTGKERIRQLEEKIKSYEERIYLLECAIGLYSSSKGNTLARMQMTQRVRDMLEELKKELKEEKGK